MNSEQMYYLILGILISQFLFDQWLDYLNKSRSSATQPKELDGIYDAEKYAQQHLYRKANYGFNMVSEWVSFAVTLLFLMLGGFAWLNTLVSSITENAIWQPLLYFACLGLGSSLISLPFSVYGTFVIEQRFGFNKMTPGLFVGDLIKSTLLTALLGGGVLALIIWVYGLVGTNFWLYAWLLVGSVMVLMSMFYTSLLLPLFNKQKPLDDGELRDAIEAFSLKSGFKLDNVFVMDGSKRSTKANAFFSGLGRKKRIVLYDTLINDLSSQEVVAVLAHEIGHYKLKHTLGAIITGLLQMGVMLYIFSLVVESPLLSAALGVETPSFHIGLLAFALLYSPVSFITGMIMSFVSRKNEYAADAFAASFGLGESLISGLKTISVNALSNLTPHPWYVFFHYSHPTLLQRMNAIRKLN